MHFDATYYNTHHLEASAWARGKLKAKFGAAERSALTNGSRLVLMCSADFSILYDVPSIGASH